MFIYAIINLFFDYRLTKFNNHLLEPIDDINNITINSYKCDNSNYDWEVVEYDDIIQDLDETVDKFIEYMINC